MPFMPESVKELRKRENLSVEELSRILNCTPLTIRNYEEGRSRPTVFSLDRIYNIAFALGHRDIEFYKPPED